MNPQIILLDMDLYHSNSYIRPPHKRSYNLKKYIRPLNQKIDDNPYKTKQPTP